MTRAMDHLIMVGNPDLLARNSIFASLIDFMKETDAYYDFGEFNTIGTPTL